MGEEIQKLQIKIYEKTQQAGKLESQLQGMKMDKRKK